MGPLLDARPRMSSDDGPHYNTPAPFYCPTAAQTHEPKQSGFFLPFFHFLPEFVS